MVAVATGRYHSIALDSDGNVWTWGLNDVGQLGRAAVPGGCAGTGHSGSMCRDGWPSKVTEFGASGVAGGAQAVTAGRYHTMVRTIFINIASMHHYYYQVSDVCTIIRCD
jgi:alpha-tubulin suppressor-like RCC1 family protein